MTTALKYFSGLIFGSVLAMNILAGCSGGGGGGSDNQGATSPTVTSNTLTSIEVTPTNPNIALGTTQQFKATGIYSDNTKQDITASVSWSSSNTTTAAISDTTDSKGLATSVASGSTTIMATSGTISGSTTITVTTATLASIGITPTNPSIALGAKQQFTATGIFSDGSKQDLTTNVTWSSSNPEFAAIDNGGLATSIAKGSTTITAASTLGGAPGNTVMTVTDATLSFIEVTPTNPSIAKGLTKQFTATGIFSDNTKQDMTTRVTWDSSDKSVATIDSAGLATSAGVGQTGITATFGGKSGSTALSVTDATLVSLAVEPTNPSIAKGLTLQFTATGIYSDGTNQDVTALVTWISSNKGAATISNADGSEGLATSVNIGLTTITANLGTKSGSSTLTVTDAALLSIEITPTDQGLSKGLTLQFTATGIYSDNTTQDLTTQVIWSSSSEAAAIISNAADSAGLATAINPGSTTIIATFGGNSGSTTLTVTDAALSSIAVEPTGMSIAKGLTLQFTATGTFSDGSTQDITAQVTWRSSDEASATISNAGGTEGLATAINPGSITIEATLAGKSGSTTLTVTDAILQSISVTPTNQTMALGTKLQYTATGIFSDATQLDLTRQVTWSSSNTLAAVISNGTQTKGLATSVGAGSTTITASFGGKSGNTTLAVITTAFSSIEVTPVNPSIRVGKKMQFTATGHFPDGSSQDLTLSVTWSSINKTVATVSNARKTRGMATGISAGSTTIRATTGGVSGTSTLTVTP